MGGEAQTVALMQQMLSQMQHMQAKFDALDAKFSALDAKFDAKIAAPSAPAASSHMPGVVLRRSLAQWLLQRGRWPNVVQLWGAPLGREPHPR